MLQKPRNPLTGGGDPTGKSGPNQRALAAKGLGSAALSSIDDVLADDQDQEDEQDNDLNSHSWRSCSC